MTTLELQLKANEVRKGIVNAVHGAKSGHPGGSLSAADVMTVLYFDEMNIDPQDPEKADRDRFVLSKGHVAPALYSTLANRGYFPVEELKTLRHLRSAWRFPRSFPVKAGEPIPCLATVRSRKDRYGRLPCLQASISWITCV